jgi:hypothetical protein
VLSANGDSPERRPRCQYFMHSPGVSPHPDDQQCLLHGKRLFHNQKCAGTLRAIPSPTRNFKENGLSKHKTRQAPKHGFSQKRAVRNFMMVSALYLSVPPVEAARPVALRGIAFSQLDIDRNGYIGRKEMSRPEFAALLQAVDFDKDGRLSEAEFAAAQSAEQIGKVTQDK